MSLFTRGSIKQGGSMVAHIDITGRNYTINEDLKKYINKKIGRLDRFIPKHARKSLKIEIRLTELKTKNDHNQCEVTLHLPEQQLTAKEATVNMFAAVDIVETKLRNQLKKYKELHGGKKSDRRGILRRVLRGQRNS